MHKTSGKNRKWSMQIVQTYSGKNQYETIPGNHSKMKLKWRKIKGLKTIEFAITATTKEANYYIGKHDTFQLQVWINEKNMYKSERILAEPYNTLKETLKKAQKHYNSIHEPKLAKISMNQYLNIVVK